MPDPALASARQRQDETFDVSIYLFCNKFSNDADFVFRFDVVEPVQAHGEYEPFTACRLTCSPEFQPLISLVHLLEMDDATQPVH